MDTTYFVRDAVGQKVYPGDTVAHITRYGSTVRIKRRVVDIEIAVHTNELHFTDQPENRRPWAKALNVVKIEEQ